MKTLQLLFLVFGVFPDFVCAELPRGGRETLPNGAVVIRSGDKVEVMDAAKELLRRHDFGALTQQARSLRESKATHSDGAWKLNSFYDAFSWFETEQEWTDVFLDLRKWNAHEINDPAPVIALANAHHGYGKRARGSGYAKSVSEEGWTFLHENLETARATLANKAARCAKCPFYYVVLMKIGIDGSETREAFMQHFDDGIRLEPGFLQLYEMKSYYLLPRWYGSEGEIREFVKDLLENHPVAALWVLWQLHRYGTYRNLFEEEDLPWSSVKEKLARSLVDGTGPAKANMLAFLADIAGDPDMVQEITIRKGFEFDISKWRSESRVREVAGQRANCPTPFLSHRLWPGYLIALAVTILCAAGLVRSLRRTH